MEGKVKDFIFDPQKNIKEKGRACSRCKADGCKTRNLLFCMELIKRIVQFLVFTGLSLPYGTINWLERDLCHRKAMSSRHHGETLFRDKAPSGAHNAKNLWKPLQCNAAMERELGVSH